MTRIDRGGAVLGLVTVLLANIRYLTGVRDVVDPGVSMDPYYIHMAAQPIGAILRGPPAWGPLYGLWLKPFVALLGDPLAVFAANLCALSIALSTAIYVHLLLLTRRPAVGVAVALLFLISDANVPLAGKVSGFALLVMLCGWSVAALVPAGARRTSVAAAAVLLASYARPELYPAAMILWLVALWQTRAGEGWSAAIWPGVALTGALAIAAAVGMPMFSPSSGDGRLLDAFREHFPRNWSVWHGQWRYYQAVWEQEFGDADSLLAAVRANPIAIAHHIADNLMNTVRALFADAFRHHPLLAAPENARGVAIEGWLIGAVVYGALALVAARATLRRDMLARYGDALLSYAAVSSLCLLAAIVIYPREHYLVIPSVLALLAAALAFTVIAPAPAARGWPVRVLAAVVCLLIVPRPFAAAEARAGSRPVTDTIAFIRAQRLPPPVHVLTLTDGIGELLGPGYEEVKIWQKGAQPLEAYVRDRHVDVVVALRMDHDNFVVDDGYWRLFRTDPGAAGFTRLRVPGHEEVGVFTRADGKTP